MRLPARRKPVKVKEKKRDEKILVSCMTCKYAELHQWGNDPIISFCKAITDDDDREVARQMRICKRYDEASTENKIIKEK